MDALSGPSGDRDITGLLAAWPYSPGALTVRRLTGADGRTLLQLRLDLGLLQMEATGRPDGQRPHGFESLLDYFEHQRDAPSRARGDAGERFTLTADQYQALREEAVMYYHRYLASFVLGDFERVVTDTARNLRLLDFVAEHAQRPDDARELAQYRPYLLMMHARARATLLKTQGLVPQARAAVAEALTAIRDHLAASGQPDAFETAAEVNVLRELDHDLLRPS